MALNKEDSVKMLSEMFPAYDLETIKILYLEYGSFERTMEKLLQGDPSTTWKTAKSKSQQQREMAQQSYNQHFPPLNTYQQQKQFPNQQINTQYYQQPQTNYQTQQRQQVQYQVPQQQQQVNKNYPSQKQSSTQFVPNNTQTMLYLPKELSNVQTNSSLFGSNDFMFIRTNSDSDCSFSSSSPFSIMPMDINSSEKSQINSDRYPHWNFSPDYAPAPMRLSKSVDALKQIQ